MAHEVFISYAVEDFKTAEAVCDALERGGIGCWYAPRDVPFGVNYEEAIIDAISESRAVVLILSSHSNDSLHVSNEIRNARAEGLAIPILPVRVENVTLSKALRYYLSSAQWLDASTPPVESHLPRLVEQLRTRLVRSAAEETAHRRLGSRTALFPVVQSGENVEDAGTRQSETADENSAPRVVKIPRRDTGRLSRTPTGRFRDPSEDSDEAVNDIPDFIGSLRPPWRRAERAVAMRRTLWVVAASFALLAAGFAIAGNLLNLTSPTYFVYPILGLMAAFLLVEGVVTYLYLSRARRVRWPLLVVILLAAMSGLVGRWVKLVGIPEARYADSGATMISGNVFADGRAVPGIEVQLLDSQGDVVQQTRMSELTGGFSFRNLSRGSVYRIYVAPSSQYAGNTVDLTASQARNEVDITLRRREGEGTHK